MAVQALSPKDDVSSFAGQPGYPNAVSPKAELSAPIQAKPKQAPSPPAARPVINRQAPIQQPSSLSREAFDPASFMTEETQKEVSAAFISGNIKQLKETKSQIKIATKEEIKQIKADEKSQIKQAKIEKKLAIKSANYQIEALKLSKAKAKLPMGFRGKLRHPFRTLSSWTRIGYNSILSMLSKTKGFFSRKKGSKQADKET